MYLRVTSALTLSAVTTQKNGDQRTPALLMHRLISRNYIYSPWEVVLLNHCANFAGLHFGGADTSDARGRASLVGNLFKQFC